MKYGGQKGGYRSYRRLERSAIAALAKPVWICRGCLVWNEPRWDKVMGKPMPPPDCISCHRMDFDYFQSQSEAKYWMRLHQRVAAKQIDQLERQIRVPLLTVHRETGKPVEFATAIFDFRWRDLATGHTIMAEYKPSDGMSEDAKLKIKCAEASGIPIEIVSL